MKLTVLSENTAVREGLECEFGLSVLLEQGDTRLLFDAGEAGAAVRNAALLGADLSRCTAVAFSHNHRDHSGGMRTLKGVLPADVPILIRPDFFRLKWWDHHHDDPSLPTYMKGMELVGPAFGADLFFAEGWKRMRMLTDDVFEVGRDVYLIGNFPVRSGFERVHVSQRMEGAGGRFPRDTFRDEQVCVVRTDRGLTVLTGCAHNGICNILETVKARFPGERLYAMFGGTHLVPPDSERIARTAAYLRESGMELIGACHCTGPAGLEAIRSAVPTYVCVGGGSIFEY